MARLTAAKRKSIPKSQFGVPAKAGSAKGKASPGSYPMPDKKHAALAKSFASRFASPAKKTAIDAKANKILGTSQKKGKK